MRKLFFGLILGALWLTSCGEKPTARVQPATQAASPSAAAERVTSVPSPTPAPLALSVNGEGVPLTRYQNEILRLESAQAALGRPADPDVDARLAANYLIDELLLAQAAREQGFQVSEAELEARLASLKAEKGEEAWAAWLKEQYYTPESFRAALRLQVEAAWMRDKIVESVPQEAEQVHLLQILLYNEEDARQVLADLQAGADFADLAWQYDPHTGGDLGWLPRGYILEPSLDEAAFALAAGEYSDVIATDVGYHLIYVAAREVRPLSTDARLVLQSEALADWLSARKAASRIEFAP